MKLEIEVYVVTIASRSKYDDLVNVGVSDTYESFEAAHDAMERMVHKDVEILKSMGNKSRHIREERDFVMVKDIDTGACDTFKVSRITAFI